MRNGSSSQRPVTALDAERGCMQRLVKAGIPFPFGPGYTALGLQETIAMLHEKGLAAISGCSHANSGIAALLGQTAFRNLQ